MKTKAELEENVRKMEKFILKEKPTLNLSQSGLQSSRKQKMSLEININAIRVEREVSEIFDFRSATFFVLPLWIRGLRIK